MSLAKLPLPVKEFLRALEDRDDLALCETLAGDAALIEEGKHIPKEALHAWSESLFSDVNFALYPTYATEIGLSTTLIVLRRGTEHRAKLALAFQQRWRFRISEDRIVTLTIMPEPLPALPAPVAAYIEATNAFDLRALLATFTDDAFVNDQLEDYWGKVAIAEWAARDIGASSSARFSHSTQQQASTNSSPNREERPARNSGLRTPIGFPVFCDEGVLLGADFHVFLVEAHEGVALGLGKHGQVHMLPENEPHLAVQLDRGTV
jgi:hypothetical protein